MNIVDGKRKTTMILWRWWRWWWWRPWR